MENQYAEIPRITNHNLQNEWEHFTVEHNLTYTCEFEGSPLPSITFYFNGRPVSTDIGVSIFNNTLTIPSPQVSHSGIYQCIVSNEFGDDQQAWLLEIREPSQFNFNDCDDIWWLFTKFSTPENYPPYGILCIL